MEPDVTQHLSCEVMHCMMKLWVTRSYMYSVFGGRVETCAFCEKWYGSNWWRRCTFRISVEILQIFMLLYGIKSSYPMTARMTSVFAGVCAVDEKLEFTMLNVLALPVAQRKCCSHQRICMSE